MRNPTWRRSSTALGMALADDTETRVLLVDGHLTRQSLSRQYRVADQPGLAESCDDRDHWRDLVCPTGCRSVERATGGGRLDRRHLQHDVLIELIPQFLKEFDYVIVHAGTPTAPLAVSALAACDVAYLVVRLGRTDRQTGTAMRCGLWQIMTFVCRDVLSRMLRKSRQGMSEIQLVTGGAGFIGSHIVEALVRRGHTVRVVDNLSTGFADNVSERAELLVGDINDVEFMTAALQDVDCVFHQAALASVPRSVENPLATHAACATGTVTILDIARRVGVRRVVYAASSSAYGDQPYSSKREVDLPMPLSPYAAAKLAGEYYCQAFYRTYGLETVGIRYFNVFGPRQDPNSPYSAVIPLFITALLAGQQPVIYGDGEQTRDFTFVRKRRAWQPAGRQVTGRRRARDQRRQRSKYQPIAIDEPPAATTRHEHRRRVLKRPAQVTCETVWRTSRWPASCSITSRRSILKPACRSPSTITGRSVS